MAFVLMIFICFGIGVILIYVFKMRKIPLYKMQRKLFF